MDPITLPQVIPDVISYFRGPGINEFNEIEFQLHQKSKLPIYIHLGRKEVKKITLPSTARSRQFNQNRSTCAMSKTVNQPLTTSLVLTSAKYKLMMLFPSSFVPNHSICINTDKFSSRATP